MTKFKALVTAGGKINGKFADTAGTNTKALIKIKEKTMLATVLEALAQSSVVEEIAVVGPKEIEEDKELVRHYNKFILEKATGSDNIMAGLEALETQGEVLLATSDLPFLTAPLVNDFVGRCVGLGTDICYPVVTKKDLLDRFPDGRKDFLKLNSGEITGGSIMLVKAESLLGNRELITRVFDSRKSLFKLAMILGVPFTFKFACGLLSLKDIEKRAAEVINCSCQAVLNCPPELALDIDNFSDYQYVINKLKA